MPEIAPPDARLSRLLFEAREAIYDWIDVVETRTGRPAVHERRIVTEIDAYRTEQGWSPDGYDGVCEFTWPNGAEDDHHCDLAEGHDGDHWCRPCDVRRAS